MRSSILSVRQAVAGLRAALLLPSLEARGREIDARIPDLQQATLTLQRLQAEERLQAEAAPLETRGELNALIGELRIVTRLIGHGLAVTHGLARLLAPPATYGPNGEVAPLQSPAAVSLKG